MFFRTTPLAVAGFLAAVCCPARGDEKLPEGAVARLGSLRFRHPAGVSAGALSPDGKLMALGGGDGLVALWDADTGKKIRTLPDNHREVTALTFAPDGKRLAAAGKDYTVRIWDVAAGKVLHVRDRLPQWAEHLAFSPDGKRLALGTTGHEVCVWEPGRPDLVTLKGHKGVVRCVAFSPDGSALASASSDQTVRLWDVAARKQRLEIAAHDGPVYAVAFSPDGNMLASGGLNGGVRLWDPRTGKRAGELVEKDEQVLALAFAPRGMSLAAGGGEGVVQVWDVAARKRVRSLEQLAPVYGVGISTDGRLLMTWSPFAARLWDAATGAERHPLAGHEGRAHCVAFTPDGKRVATAGADRTLRLWDTATGRELWRRREHRAEIYSLAVAAGEKGLLLATASIDGDIRVWDGAGKELHRLSGEGIPFVVALSPDGRTLAVPRRAGSVLLYDTATGNPGRLRDAKALQLLAFGPTGRLLATDHEKLRLWDVKTGSPLWERENRPFGLCFSADERLLGVSEGPGGVRLLETATGQPRAYFSDAGGGPDRACFSPDGRTLAVVSPKGEPSVRLLSVATGKELRRLGAGADPVLALAFAPVPVALGKAGGPPRGLLASACGDGTVLLWDVSGVGRKPARKPKDRELEAAWDALAADDAQLAHTAVWALADTGAAGAEFLGTKLRPVAPVDPKELARLVGELDSKRFADREKAQQALAEAGEAVTGALRRALKGEPSLEMKRRVEAILDRIEGKGGQREWVRYLRALEALELSGDDEARRLLKRLAGGLAGARRTDEAVATLKRLASAKPGVMAN